MLASIRFRSDEKILFIKKEIVGGELINLITSKIEFKNNINWFLS